MRYMIPKMTISRTFSSHNKSIETKLTQLIAQNQTNSIYNPVPGGRPSEKGQD